MRANGDAPSERLGGQGHRRRDRTHNPARLFVVVLALLLGAVAVVGGISSAVTTPSGSSKGVELASTSEVSLLFVLSAQAGTFVRTGGSSTTFVLTLSGSDAKATWFSDRPAKEAGEVATSTLIDDWSRFGFSISPPNVAVELDAAHPGSDTVVGQLSAPRFDPTAHAVTATFTVFTGQRLAEAGGHLSYQAGRARGALLPASFGSSSLFIDGSVMVPTDVSQWTYHSVVPNDANATKYIAGFDINTAPGPGTDEFIYSMPATSLIAGFSNAHLSTAASGISLTP